MDHKKLKIKTLKINFETGIILFFSVIILCFFVFRIIRGVDTTDESYYSTMAYRLFKGNSLFRDSWDPSITSAVIPVVLLKIFIWISGSSDGIILFFRFSFLICNFGAAVVLYNTQKQYLKSSYAVLISLFYLIYAPFQIYTFSYNSLSDMFLMLVINIILLGVEKENNRFFFAAGVFCAFMAFTYPTMIVFCPIMVILLLLKRKIVKRGWIYFTLGGIICACIIGLALILTIGFDGIKIGLEGMLSNSVYGSSALSLSARISQLSSILKYLFVPIQQGGIWFQIYSVWLVLVLIMMKKFPALKFTLVLYPVVALISYHSICIYETLNTINFIFFISFLSPFLRIFVKENKRVFNKFLYFEWLPSVFFYMILAYSTAGGGLQATQGLIVASIITLKGIAIVLEETFEECNLNKWFANKRILGNCKQWTVAAFLAIAVVSQMYVHCSAVYRDAQLQTLTSKIEEGPYKGLFTTERKKVYLEDMTRVMNDLQEKDKTVLVLYHANFAYLMIDMMPATPSTWGLYWGSDNQNQYLEYFSHGGKYIPDIIYIVNVPEEFNYDMSREENYEYCKQIRTLISENYLLTDEVVIGGTGSVKKYNNILDEKSFLNSLEKIKQNAL